MSRIRLKPGSPEFADKNKKEKHAKRCEMPGCDKDGEHRAPKDRELTAYYKFCQDHVREYNKAWNFFSGMSDSEVHEEMMNSFYGDRPTWKYGVGGESMEEELKRKSWESYTGKTSEDPNEYQKRRYQFHAHSNTPEFEAMAIMGLQPPLTFAEIRTRYKELAKKHHPDLNKGCKESENILKQVNMAHTILKLAYENFDKLKKKEND